MPNFVTTELLEKIHKDQSQQQTDNIASIRIGITVFVQSLLESSEIDKNNMLEKINEACEAVEKDKHGLSSPNSLLLDIREIVSQSIAKESSNHPIV